MDVLHWLNQNHLNTINHFQSGIIPMVLIPLTAVTVAITSIAGIIAGWFGIKLHTEGPKQFLEVLLKKRVLASMIVVNLVGLGAYKSYIYIKNLPSFIFTIERNASKNNIPGDSNYENSFTRFHGYVGKINQTEKVNLELTKEIKIKKGAFRSGVISSNSIFYGTDDGQIYEFDKADLTVKRKFFIGTQVTTRPVIYNNKIYTGEGNHYTHHARIYSYDLKSSKFLGALQTKGHTEGQPFLGQYNNKNILFATAGVDGLYAIDPDNMKTIWHKIDGHLDASVTIENNRVYIGTAVEKGFAAKRSYAVAYDFESGKEIWKKELPISNWMHPIISSVDVCYVLGEIYLPSDVGMLYCLNKFTGAPHFALPFNAPIASKPYYVKDGSNEYVYFADFHGEICGIDLNKKEKMWCHNTGSKDTDYALSSVDYDSKRGIIWYPTLDNGIYAFDPITGKMLVHWQPNKNQASWKENYGSVNIDGNNIYSMDTAGNLRKFEIK